MSKAFRKHGGDPSQVVAINHSKQIQVINADSDN